MESSGEEDNVNVNVPSGYIRPPPTFLKLYQPYNSLSLEIPSAFFSSFGQSIPNAITLKNTSGMTWSVTLETVANHLHITSGWGHYVRDHPSLTTGDFLLFQYLQRNVFLVMVHAADGCLKQEPPIFNPTSSTNKGGIAESRKRSHAPACSLEDFRFQRIFNHKFSVCVPKNIIDACKPKLPQRIKLSNSEGEGVVTELRGAEDRVILGYKGMGEFWRMNNVQKGDILQFEFICSDGTRTKKIKEVLMTNVTQSQH